MTTAHAPASGYPVHVEARLDDHLSRWLWLVKWLLVLPHVVVLAFLWLGFVVLTAAAMVAIVVTGRYPRVLFDYNVGVLRWTWRVAYYAYGALGTDEYPPFTLADRPDYPARFDVDPPGELSRGLALVKWWLLALPHYLVVGLFVGGGAYATTRDDAGGGFSLVGLLVLFAGVALLVRGAYPRSIFDFVLGMNRWALRVAAYAGLMTDRYPPFRLDLGGDDPGSVAVARPPAPSTAPVPAPVPPPTTRGGWTGGRVTGVVLGAVGLLAGLGLVSGGVVVLALDGPVRDDSGFVLTERVEVTTPTAALTSRLHLPVEGPDWFYGPEQLGTVRVDVRPDGEAPVFVGIAARDDLSTFLRGAAHDEVSSFDPDPQYARSSGQETGVVAPQGLPWWVASAQGSGDVGLTWQAQEGDWAVVLVNADGSLGVTADVRVGATLPHLDEIGAGLLAAGLVVLIGSGLVVGAAVRSAGRGTAQRTTR